MAAKLEDAIAEWESFNLEDKVLERRFFFAAGETSGLERARSIILCKEHAKCDILKEMEDVRTSTGNNC